MTPHNFQGDIHDAPVSEICQLLLKNIRSSNNYVVTTALNCLRELLRNNSEGCRCVYQWVYKLLFFVSSHKPGLGQYFRSCLSKLIPQLIKRSGDSKESVRIAVSFLWSGFGNNSKIDSTHFEVEVLNPDCTRPGLWSADRGRDYLRQRQQIARQIYDSGHGQQEVANSRASYCAISRHCVKIRVCMCIVYIQADFCKHSMYTYTTVSWMRI